MREEITVFYSTVGLTKREKIHKPRSTLQSVL